MRGEILINVTPQETRVAIVENASLQEVHIERTRRLGIVANIYKGKVARVLPGMDAAFVDIGLERAAFLHVSDMADNQIMAQEQGVETSVQKNIRPIQELLSEGQEILVQVIKDPLGGKGARLTTHLTIASRYLVLMPHDPNIAVSAKIELEADRDKLRELVQQNLPVDHQRGYIIRTAAESADSQVLVNDLAFLDRLWSSIEKNSARAKPGDLVYEDPPLVLRTLRDLVDTSVEKIRIDSRSTCKRMREFSAEFIPEVEPRIEHYPGERPIFDVYGVEEEIQKALQRKVQLKSGGYLSIDQTEAMTTIDVNTGAFVGHRNLEETIFKTNLEAAQAIARQLRLRNLGGIIILDFIDMLEEEHKTQVLRALEKELEKDHAKTQVCSVSSLGLVEMTRKRTRESLEHVLCEPCPLCDSRGSVKSPQTVCYEIFREILREARQFDAKELRVLAAQEVLDVLLEEESNGLAELEEFIGIPIRLQLESMYRQEEFDVVLI